MLRDNPLVAKTHLVNVAKEFFDEQYELHTDMEMGRMQWQVRVMHKKLRRYAVTVVDPEVFANADNFREAARFVFEGLQEKLFQQMAIHDGTHHSTVQAFHQSRWHNWGADDLKIPMEVDALMLLLGWKFAHRVIPQQHRCGVWVVKPGVWASAVPRHILEGVSLERWQEYLAQVFEQNPPQRGTDET